jgi:hypothetical protein
MKAVSLVLFITLVFSTNLFGQKSVTVTGEIVELKTFVVDKIKPNSPSGIEVTKEGLMKGGTFALVEKKTNKVVILIPSAVNKNLYGVLEPYLGMQVFIKGQQYSTGGVRVLTVDDIGKSLK